MNDEFTKHIEHKISIRIRQERQLKELSQEEVIEILSDEISVATLSRYENCSGIMTVRTLAKIAMALNISVSDLLGETENLTESREAAKFIFYYPLIPKEIIADVIWRIGGLFYGREDYVNQLLSKTVEDIPDSPAKKWADFNVNYRPFAIKYQQILGHKKGLEFLRKHPEVMALFGDDSPDECYNAYYEMLINQRV